jgi:hypothetical protein
VSPTLSSLEQSLFDQTHVTVFIVKTDSNDGRIDIMEIHGNTEACSTKSFSSRLVLFHHLLRLTTKFNTGKTLVGLFIMA